jgi:hypothetical protein
MRRRWRAEQPCLASWAGVAGWVPRISLAGRSLLVSRVPFDALKNVRIGFLLPGR